MLIDNKRKVLECCGLKPSPALSSPLPRAFVTLTPRFRHPYPALSSPSRMRGSSLFLTACISGFPAFAENDGRRGRFATRARLIVTLAPRFRYPYPALSSPSRMRGSSLDFHSWFSGFQPLIIGQRSFQSGLNFSIKSSFQARFHFFNAFSQVIADSIEGCCSNQTNECTWCFLVNPSTALVRCCQIR